MKEWKDDEIFHEIGRLVRMEIIKAKGVFPLAMRPLFPNNEEGDVKLGRWYKTQIDTHPNNGKAYEEYQFIKQQALQALEDKQSPIKG
jgi:hypothetical protein